MRATPLVMQSINLKVLDALLVAGLTVCSVTMTSLNEVYNPIEVSSCAYIYAARKSVTCS